MQHYNQERAYHTYRVSVSRLVHLRYHTLYQAGRLLFLPQLVHILLLQLHISRAYNVSVANLNWPSHPCLNAMPKGGLRLYIEYRCSCTCYRLHKVIMHFRRISSQHNISWTSKRVMWWPNPNHLSSRQVSPPSSTLGILLKFFALDLVITSMTAKTKIPKSKWYLWE